MGLTVPAFGPVRFRILMWAMVGPLGLPLYPNAVYLVISVAENDPPKLAAFEWDPELREFVGRGVREVG